MRCDAVESGPGQLPRTSRPSDLPAGKVRSTAGLHWPAEAGTPAVRAIRRPQEEPNAEPAWFRQGIRAAIVSVCETANRV